jgi:hypothetical protein
MFILDVHNVCEDTFLLPSFLNSGSARAIHSTLSKMDVELLPGLIWAIFLSVLPNKSILHYAISCSPARRQLST